MITENVILSESFIWTDIEGPSRVEIPFIEEEFNFPAIFLGDFLRHDQLPKYEMGATGHFFLFRFFDTRSGPEDISVKQVTNKLALFVNEHFAITLHGEGINFNKSSELWSGIEENLTPPNLVHRLLHLLVLSYEEALARLQNDYEEFEREILSVEGGALSQNKVYLFRRRLFVIQGTIQVLQQALHDSRGFWGDQIALQQDIKENLAQLSFRLDGISKNFDQLFQLHFMMSDTRNNEVMKVLTIFASLMLPLTFISSFYGMNFRHLPGGETTTGFVACVILMATTTFLTASYFYRKKWFKTSL